MSERVCVRERWERRERERKSVWYVWEREGEGRDKERSYYANLLWASETNLRLLLISSGRLILPDNDKFLLSNPCENYLPNTRSPNYPCPWNMVLNMCTLYSLCKAVCMWQVFKNAFFPLTCTHTHTHIHTCLQRNIHTPFLFSFDATSGDFCNSGIHLYCFYFSLSFNS